MQQSDKPWLGLEHIASVNTQTAGSDLLNPSTDDYSNSKGDYYEVKEFYSTMKSYSNSQKKNVLHGEKRHLKLSLKKSLSYSKFTDSRLINKNEDCDIYIIFSSKDEDTCHYT